MSHLKGSAGTEWNRKVTKNYFYALNNKLIISFSTSIKSSSTCKEVHRHVPAVADPEHGSAWGLP